MFLFRFFFFVVGGVFKVLCIVAVSLLILTYTNDATAEVKDYIGDVKDKVVDVQFSDVKQIAVKGLEEVLKVALETVQGFESEGKKKV